MNKIILVTNEDGDYEALYLNGKIIVQGSSVPRFELTDTMSKNQPYEYETHEVTADWIEDFGGNYPDSLLDIPQDAYTD